MSEYVTLMWGRLDGSAQVGTVNQMVADLNLAMPLRIELVVSNNLICELIGDGVIFHLSYEPGDEEPWSSHPFMGEIETIGRGLDDRAVADKLFDALAETGRYRVLLVYEDDVRRATHFPTGPW